MQEGEIKEMNNIMIEVIKPKKHNNTINIIINNKQICLTALSYEQQINLSSNINNLALQLTKGKVEKETIDNLNYRNVLELSFFIFDTLTQKMLANEYERMLNENDIFNDTVYRFMNKFFDTSTIPPNKYKKYFLKEMDTINDKILRKIIQEVLERKLSFSDYYPNLNLRKLINILMNEHKQELIEYINFCCKEFTHNRDIITLVGLKARTITPSYGYKIEDTEFNQLLCDAVSKEYTIQKKALLESNNKEYEKDIWTLYDLDGITIVKRTFKFNLIKPYLLREEIKNFVKHNLKCRRAFIESSLDLMIPILSIITDRYPNVQCFSDIDRGYIDDAITILETTPLSISKKNNIAKVYKPSTIRKMIQTCGLAVEFLQKNKIKSIPTPRYNFFKDYTFPNMRGIEKKTDVIPEYIIDKIDEHSDELMPDIKLIYDIFRNTGLRAKEVLFLQEGCVEEIDDENLAFIKYIPYKILRQLRLKGLKDTSTMLVPKNVAELINIQAERTKELRKKYNTKFIFIVESNNGTKANVRSDNGIRAAVNKLIKDNNIIDKDGVLWNFTTRQFRKTLVSIMIENNATTQEISYWLGHLSSRTERDYYEEFEKNKLAKLNTEFFKNKFEVILNKNDINEFTEEERKCLYIDFLLGYRKVELGYCIKKISDGPCGRDIGGITCANCNKLCTGKAYLPEWEALRDSAMKIVNNMIDIYKKEGISNYNEFREFQQEMHYLNIYQNVIDKINKNA